MLTGLLVILLAAGLVGSGYLWSQSISRPSFHAIRLWQGKLRAETAQLKTLNRLHRSEIDALAERVAGLEARMAQLDALGGELTHRAGISPHLFNFNAPVPEGGLTSRAGEIPMTGTELEQRIGQLADRIGAERLALQTLNRRVVETSLRREIIPSGHPVQTFWVSSPFGWRIDPITGRLEFHEGIDLAAPEGEPIHAVAAGVVTWAGPRYGFGNIVMINDGQGYTTYYAHCEKVFVKIGQVIRRGETIALVGSTGMSTGPHVHFEVLRDNRPVNPAPFVFGAPGA
ncbi:M23 peptidase domain protein [mine drainage metagenome]|uniref:M23 peptidase domain protein n=1 Tax=mine drainage metagenome TaxID=410659 RepID=T1D2S3_9ZZZZ